MGYRIKTTSKPAMLNDAQLVGGLERVWLKIEENRRAVLGGILLVFVAIAAVAAVLYYDHLQAEKAMGLHRQASALLRDRPADQPAKAEENLKQAIALYRQVAEQYPRSATAPLALYDLGNALMQANDVTGAIDAYKTYLASYRMSPPFVGLVQQRLAFAYLLNGDREQAEKHFQAVLEMPAALNKDVTLFELGKLEEAQSRPEAALARYQDLIKTSPASPLAGEAEIRIKALGGKVEGPPLVSPLPPGGGPPPAGRAESPKPSSP
jgi:tetratricopeptide (TPR) repeat protein